MSKKQRGRERKMGGVRDRQTETYMIQAHRQTGRQADYRQRQTDRQTDRQTETGMIQTHRQAGGL